MATTTHKYLLVDTETTGLFRYDQPADAEGQPRMAQLAMLYLNENFEVWGIENMLIRPYGWKMSDEAAKIHGLTQEILMERGYPIADALRAFNGALDDGRIIVGYNVSYDLKVLRGELRRAGLPDRFETTQSVDCMRKLTPVCKIAKASGKGYKWPKLTEAYKHVTGKELIGAHGALEDTHACREVFKWMVAEKMFTEAAISDFEESVRQNSQETHEVAWRRISEGADDLRYAERYIHSSGHARRIRGCGSAGDHIVKLTHIAIWTIYWSAVAAGMLLLVWGAKVAIKNVAERYRDPLGRFEYGERHSDFDGE